MDNPDLAEFNKDLSSALKILQDAYFGKCCGIILPTSELASVILLIEKYLHMETELEVG